jgi:hypothetical protein
LAGANQWIKEQALHFDLSLHLEHTKTMPIFLQETESHKTYGICYVCTNGL